MGNTLARSTWDARTFTWDARTFTWNARTFATTPAVEFARRGRHALRQPDVRMSLSSRGLRRFPPRFFSTDSGRSEQDPTGSRARSNVYVVLIVVLLSAAYGTLYRAIFVADGSDDDDDDEDDLSYYMRRGHQVLFLPRTVEGGQMTAFVICWTRNAHGGRSIDCNGPASDGAPWPTGVG